VNNYSLQVKMITNNTKKVLNCLLRNPERKNINQISRELHISVGGAFKILKDLEGRNWINPKILGNATYYELDFENRELIKILELILIEEKRELKGSAAVYSKELEIFDCSLIVLFGSILHSKIFNDVDVLFVEVIPKKISEFCLEISKVKSKPVVPFILKKGDLIKELKNRKDSVLEIFKTGIVLKGENLFIEVLKDAKK